MVRKKSKAHSKPTPSNEDIIGMNNHNGEMKAQPSKRPRKNVFMSAPTASHRRSHDKDVEVIVISDDSDASEPLPASNPRTRASVKTPVQYTEIVDESNESVAMAKGSRKRRREQTSQAEMVEDVEDMDEIIASMLRS